jgi:hypothetical protein
MGKLAGLLIGLALLIGMTSSVASQPTNFAQEEAAYQQALQYIDQHRKSDVSISVVDQAGAAIKGASVSYQQTTHDFLFGIFGSPGWATPSDDAPGWYLFEFTQGQYHAARHGEAQVVSGENCRSGSCLHVKVNGDQNLGINSDDVSIEPGAQYEATFWIKVIQAPALGIGPTFGIYWGKGAVGSAWQGVAFSSVSPQLTVGDYIPITIKVAAPTAATRAIIGVLVNLEGALPGDVEFYLDDVTFTRTGATQNLLRNPGFEETEAQGWALYSKLCAASETIIFDWREWSAIEPQRGVFQWDNADWWFQRILDHCPTARFVLLFDDFSGPASWVLQRDPNWLNLNDLTDPGVLAQFEQDFYGYVSHVVKRYASKVAFWITENEIDAPSASDWLKTIDNEIAIDRTLVQAIRDTQADAKILLMAGLYLNYAQTEPFDFAQQALASGLQVDSFTLEAYPNWDPFYKLGRTPVFYANYIEKMATLGKPVFVQETGYPSQPCAPCDYSAWTAWNRVFDEPTQAAWVKYMTAIPFGTANVMGVINFPDDLPDPSSLFRDFGLFTRDGRTKQAYDMYRQLIQGFTTAGSGTTDASGKLGFRGFAGEYSVTVSAPDGRKVEQTIHVSETGGNSFTITLR